MKVMLETLLLVRHGASTVGLPQQFLTEFNLTSCLADILVTDVPLFPSFPFSPSLRVPL